jgi:hypothetical protein
MVANTIRYYTSNHLFAEVVKVRPNDLKQLLGGKPGFNLHQLRNLSNTVLQAITEQVNKPFSHRSQASIYRLLMRSAQLYFQLS